MKYLIILLFPLLLFSNEQRIILTGMTIHEHQYDRFGEEYNAFNWGAGYEYNFFNHYNEFYFAANALVLNDSFENPQLSIGMGHYYRFDLGIVDAALGLTGFVGWKKIYTDEDQDREGGQYGLTGGLGLATTVYYESFAVNFVYVPGVAFKDFDTTGFLFTYFSFSF